MIGGSIKQLLERDIRDFASELGLNLHRFNDVNSHWRGYIVEDCDWNRLYRAQKREDVLHWLQDYALKELEIERP